MHPRNQGTIKRYSIAFKQKVVSEIESGKLNISQARSLYGIGGFETIQKWIKKLGKLHLLNKVIRIELKDEVSKLKQLEKEKKELESALARAHLKLIVYETIIEVADEELGTDLKKKLESRSSIEAVKGSKNLSRKGK